MNETDSQAILATISPSAPRRLLGVTVLSVLGGLLLYLGLNKPPAHFGWQIFLFATGAVVLVLAEALRRATAEHLQLTEETLSDSSGRIVASIDQIARVERGTFAIKPSNGFSLRLSQNADRGNYWAPGLWWRLGRSVGVGGITSPAETKAVAEMLTVLVAQHQGAKDQ